MFDSLWLWCYCLNAFNILRIRPGQQQNCTLKSLFIQIPIFEVSFPPYLRILFGIHCSIFLVNKLILKSHTKELGFICYFLLLFFINFYNSQDNYCVEIAMINNNKVAIVHVENFFSWDLLWYLSNGITYETTLLLD